MSTSKSLCAFLRLNGSILQSRCRCIFFLIFLKIETRTRISDTQESGSVSPVFHAEATAVQEQQQLNKLFNSCFQLLLLGLQGRVSVKTQNKVKTLIHVITENRKRRASGPVQALVL